MDIETPFALLAARWHGFLWRQREEPQHGLRYTRMQTLRILHHLAHDVAHGQLSLWAMSLVYTTLLALIPLLAVGFSVLKAFGVHKHVQPLLYDFLLPLGDKGIEIGDRIISFVDNIQVGLLGAVGLAILMYMVVSLLQKIEHTFNTIWNIDHSRSMARRFSDYLSVILVGPVLVFTAIGITASARNTAVVQKLLEFEVFGELLHLLGQMVPYFLIIGAFTFLYMFIPNTRVQLRSALPGAIVAGVLWESIGWMFAAFVAGSTRYTAIYSSLAILVLFMFWIYVGWLILLLGVKISYYIQHPAQVQRPPRDEAISGRLSRSLALSVMYLIARAHRGERAGGLTFSELNAVLGAPPADMRRVVRHLVDGGFLSATADNPARFLPARAAETISVREIMHSLDEDDRYKLPPPVAELTGRLRAARDAETEQLSLRDLVDRAAENLADEEEATERQITEHIA